MGDCIDNCKCEKRVEDKLITSKASREVKLEKLEESRPPVKRHMSELRIEIQTPKPGKDINTVKIQR
jgi:hypothetical protein